jgi:VIT1/CCC1 family predicted Fe2+/Mn2+ transporter
MDKQVLLEFQLGEITEHHIYERLARIAGGGNAEVLRRLSKDELRHYRTWAKLSGEEVKPDRIKIAWYSALARLFGLTFVVKLMERGEEEAQEKYKRAAKEFPQARKIVKEELEHEQLLVEMIDEERVKHVGSMVLGINDALVEITGTLAGLTFALQNSQLVGLAGIITGISATMSMGASEYLSQRSEGNAQALRAASYTAAAYLFAVVLLVAPFFLLGDPLAAMALALLDGLLVIAVFTFFTSVIRDRPFRRGFLEMAGISTGVAVASFLIGLAARQLLGVDAG